MEDKKMENQNVEAQEILVDGKAVAEQPKKVGTFQKIKNGIKAGGRFVWEHKGTLIGIAAGFGLKCALDWAKGGITIDEDEETYDDSEEESNDDDAE